MGLEAASWITDLVSTNPVGATDKKSQGDDHIRLIKVVLQACFPAASKAFYFPRVSTKTADFTVVAADSNKTFVVDTTAGVVTATLPTLAAGDDGWACHFLKSNTGLNPLFISPASGSVFSGEIGGITKCRRVIPGRQFSAMWSGSNWFVDRIPREPIGTVFDSIRGVAPPGYELAYGQTLASAITNYQEYYQVVGSGVVTDARGLVIAGQDDMGGTSANRLTGLSGGVDGDNLGATGGSESHVLTEAQLALHTHAALNVDVLHDHGVQAGTQGGSGSLNAASGGFLTVSGSAAIDVLPAYSGFTTTNANTGSNAAHNNVQPTLILNKMVVVE